MIIPANNEAGLIGSCLNAIAASRDPHGWTVEAIVAANGCHDTTVACAHQYTDTFAQRGWRLLVIDLPEGSKPVALNAADLRASGQIRIYLDADVTMAPGILSDVVEALDAEPARYASGALDISAEGWISKAYARIWRQVPFMRDVVPGCGLFAVNAAGRKRWSTFPQIISDDIFVRLQFAPDERVGVPATYRWPIAEGWKNLVKVRRRQNAGVDEIAEKYPRLLENDDKPSFPTLEKLRLAAQDPMGFAVYSGVALAVKLSPRAQQDWSRGR